MVPGTKRTVAVLAAAAMAAGAGPAKAAATGLTIGLVPVDFVLFAAILLGVAVFHHHTFKVAVLGLGAIIAWKLGFGGFETGPGLAGLGAHLRHEWVGLANLFCLLMGFAVLARQFEQSRLPDVLPAVLPDGWTGGFWLLVIVFVLSSFLDNIAAALIGGTMARGVFRGRVHIGYVAAVVAAANAGGAGSVVGDTTTTMMWIDGISPLSVLEAYIAAGVALVVCAIPAAQQQHAHAPITRDAAPGVTVDWVRVAIVLAVLLAAILVNVWANLAARHLAGGLPLLGLTVWTAIGLTAPLRRPDWSVLPASLPGTLFLLALVTSASLMPVEALPAASWPTTLGLGFFSAVFDNIPLTALALRQGGYDWGYLAYAVGFGGSMIWFGSSAGVAITGQFPDARSVTAWLRHGWHVALAYVAGFLVMLALLGWHPDRPHKPKASALPTAQPTAVARDLAKL